MSVADIYDPAAGKRMENGAVLAVGNHALGNQHVKFLSFLDEMLRQIPIQIFNLAEAVIPIKMDFSNA